MGASSPFHTGRPYGPRRAAVVRRAINVPVGIYRPDVYDVSEYRITPVRPLLMPMAVDADKEGRGANQEGIEADGCKDLLTLAVSARTLPFGNR